MTQKQKYVIKIYVKYTCTYILICKPCLINKNYI